MATTKPKPEKKIYLIVGVGYSAHFDSIKDRNAFRKQVDEIYNTVKNDPRWANRTALHSSISVAVAKALKVKIHLDKRIYK